MSEELLKVGLGEGESSLAIASIWSTIQPLQDLAKNWDIDISSSLEEYLHELSDIHPPDLNGLNDRFTSDGDSLNFARAALVVQNSSHIYSRKVDFLHKLVYKQLDELLTQADTLNPSCKANSKRSLAVDADVLEFMNCDANHDFLLLDDFLPVVDRTGAGNGNTIDIVDTFSGDRKYLHEFNRSSIVHSSNISNTRFSLDALAETTHTTNSTIDRISFGNHNVATQFGKYGNLVGRNKLRLMHGGSEISDNGILSIPGMLPLYSEANNRDNFTSDRNPLDIPLGDKLGGEHICFGEVYDDDNGSFGIQLENHFEIDGEVSTDIHAPLRRRGIQNEIDIGSRPTTIYLKSWKNADPLSIDSSKFQPLIVGRTIVRPPELQDLPSHYVAGLSITEKYQSEKNNLPNPAPRHISAFSSFRATVSRKRRLAEETNECGQDELWKTEHSTFFIPMKGLLFGKEFEYIALLIAKRQSTTRRKKDIRRGHSKHGSGVPKELTTDIVENLYDHDDNDAYGLDNYEIVDCNLGDVPYGCSSVPVETNTGFHSFDEVFGTTSEGENDGSGFTFEELCRAHISRFRRGAERYAAETQLNTRVNNWQNRLSPILFTEEHRKVFDIYEYGANVINVIEHTQQKRLSPITGDKHDLRKRYDDFHDVCSGLPMYEVCRYFLASLTLCNSGNITFKDVEKRKHPSSPLCVHLLNSRIDNPTELFAATGKNHVSHTQAYDQKQKGMQRY